MMLGYTLRMGVLSSLLFLSMTTRAFADEQVVPLVHAHAHNDYLHTHPLSEALEHGFCSVEADIFLVKGELLVAHSWLELRDDRTLKRLYLEPLRKRVKQNGGRVFRDGPIFTLLIDIKTDGKNVYPVLDNMLASYKDMLTTVENGKVRRGAVQVVISGDRPRELIAEDKTRYAGIDGRLGDIGSEAAAHLIPMISDKWSSHFRWGGKGKMPEEQRRKLHDIVKQAHESGRRVRFWAAPESETVWGELLEAGVDHINTDELDRLRKFLENRRSTSIPMP